MLKIIVISSTITIIGSMLSYIKLPIMLIFPLSKPQVHSFYSKVGSLLSYFSFLMSQLCSEKYHLFFEAMQMISQIWSPITIACQL